MLQEVARIDTNQEKELTKHLRNHLGNEFCPTRAKIDMFSDGYMPIVLKNYVGLDTTNLMNSNEEDSIVSK